MGAYSKFIGAVIGGLVSWGIAKDVIPAEWNTPDMMAAMTTVVTALVVWLSPANA